MNPLLGQGDGTWSSRLGESGWPDAGNSDTTDSKDWQQTGGAFSDLVPEFEPGKPWKVIGVGVCRCFEFVCRKYATLGVRIFADEEHRGRSEHHSWISGAFATFLGRH